MGASRGDAKGGEKGNDIVACSSVIHSVFIRNLYIDDYVEFVIIVNHNNMNMW